MITQGLNTLPGSWVVQGLNPVRLDEGGPGFIPGGLQPVAIAEADLAPLLQTCAGLSPAAFSQVALFPIPIAGSPLDGDRAVAPMTANGIACAPLDGNRAVAPLSDKLRACASLDGNRAVASLESVSPATAPLTTRIAKGELS